VENNKKDDSDGQAKGFQPKVLLIWLAVLAAIIGLVMAQSGEITPSQLSISSIDDLITAAKQDRVDKAIIQSDPKGGEDWYTIQGKIQNPAFEIDENQYKTLPFVVKGRVTESDYKELRDLLGTRPARRTLKHHLDGITLQPPSISSHYWSSLLSLCPPIANGRKRCTQFWQKQSQVAYP